MLYNRSEQRPDNFAFCIVHFAFFIFILTSTCSPHIVSLGTQSAAVHGGAVFVRPRLAADIWPPLKTLCRTNKPSSAGCRPFF